MALPAWSAAMVQVPADTPETVLPLVPLTEQTEGVFVVKVTARPEVAEALAVVVPPTFRVGGVNVIAPIVWVAGVAVVLLVTCGAGL